MGLRNTLIFFALVAGTIAVPINVQDGDIKCARTCTESLSDNTKFQYMTGSTYTYSYEGTTETRLQGASSQTSTLTIQATADIEVISTCEFNLKLRQVSLLENGAKSSSSNDFGQRLQSNGLRFAFQDGRIEDLCPVSAEDDRVLNIKKAILSAFQNSMEKLDQNGVFQETDVSGSCDTTYESSPGYFGHTSITKTKDILSCTDRNGNISSLHAESYRVPSGVQSMPLMKSSHECQQEIKGGHIQTSKCTEILTFRPFSKDNSGAVTTATQVMTFKSSTRSITNKNLNPVERRSNLLFQHNYDESIDVNAKSDVIATLTEICTEVSNGITSRTPILFGTLISKMRKLDTDKMSQVYTAVTNGRICTSVKGKQFFFDAIPAVATEASLALTNQLIAERTVQGAEAEMWLTQLAFIPRPTVAMLRQIKPLLSNEEYKNRTLLGVSAMVHKICDTNSECSKEKEIADFIEVLGSNIGSSCTSSTSEQREMILLTLKAFGNAGNAVTSSSVIGRCVANRDLDEEIRVAALQAYRRMPCSVSREDAMRLYQNAENDAELRIHAFLAVMSCPSEEALTKVKMALSGEPVNQVGSFVWTYLENLKETASPFKQVLSSILQDAKLREDFNCDVRKFSRNVEKSFFSEYLNVGAQVESNIIFSQKSYIPRSGMLNITIDMFGNSVNLLEVGGRVQGLEKIAEKFFGPNGYFNPETSQELMDNKRQTANTISVFDSLFKTPSEKARGSMYVKMFGNEIRYNEMDSDKFAQLQDFNVLEMLIKLAEPKNLELTRNFQFLDSTLIIPTAIGLPLNLTVNGSASVSIDMNGNIDLRNIAAAPRSLDIKGYIRPSAAVVVSGIMGVDAIVAKSSMKMVATMHTSTQLEGKAQIQNGQVINVELNMPQEKMEIIHVQTEFFMNDEKLALPSAAQTFKKCSGSAMTKIAGVEICADISLPTFFREGLPLPPFTGPVDAQISIVKKDTHTGYTFTAKYENERQFVNSVTFTKRLAHISLDTPGSQVDRKMLIEVSLDPASMAVSANLLSPWKKMSYIGSLTNTPELKSAISTLTLDADQKYSVQAKLAKSEKSVKVVYSPSLIVNIPNKPEMSVTANFEYGTGKVLAGMDLSVSKFTRKPITMTGSIQQLKGGQAYSIDWNLASEPLTSKLEGTMDVKAGSYNMRSSLTYALNSRPEHRFSLSGKFANTSKGELRSYSLQGGFITTEFPMFAFNIESDVQATQDHVDTTLKITHGENKNTLSVSHKSRKQGDLSALTLESTSTLKYPYMGIDFSTDFKHKHSMNEVVSSLDVIYTPGKTVSLSVDLKNKMAATNVISGDLRLSYPGSDLRLSSDVTRITPEEYKHNLQAKWGGKDSTLGVSSSWKSGDLYELTSDIKYPGYPVRLSASVRPNMSDFVGQAAVTLRQATYSTRAAYKIQSDTITSSAEVVIPQRTLNYEVELRRSSAQMYASAQAKWDAVRDASKMVSVNAEYNIRDASDTVNRDTRLTTVTPYGTVSLSTSAEKSSLLGRGNLELSALGKKSVFNTEYDLNQGISARASIDSPYIQYGPVQSIQASVSAKSVGDTVLNYDGEVSWNPTNKITGSAVWTRKSNTIAEIRTTVTTPFAGFTSFGASVEGSKTATGNSLQAKAFLNEQEAKLELNHTGISTGTVTVTYPGRTLSGSFSQNGDIKEFKGEVNMSWELKKQIWSKVEWSSKGPITATIDVTTPFQIKKMSASFNHDGTPKNFNTNVALIWDNNQIRSKLTFTPKQAKLTVNTPWRKMLAQYQLTGNSQSFAATGLVQPEEGNTISANVNYKAVNGLTGDFKLTAPKYFNEVSGNLDFSGKATDFNNKATVSWSPNQQMSLTAVFSLTNGITLDAQFRSPFEVVSKLGASVTHKGSFQQWENRAEITYNNLQPITLYSERKADGKMTGKVGVQNLPLKSVQQMEISADHSMVGPKTTSVVTVTWNGDKSMVGRVNLNTKTGYEGTATFTSPFWDDISAELKHKGDIRAFDTMATVSWKADQKITVSSNVNTKNGFDARLRLDSPWKKVSFAATQQGNEKEMTANAVLTWDKNQTISTSLEFSQIGDIKLTWTLKTPFTAVQEASATFTQRGTDPMNFYNQIEGSLNGQKASVGTTVDLRSGVTLRVVFINPWKSCNMELVHKGDLKQFNSRLDLGCEDQTFSGKVEFSRLADITAKLDLSSSMYQPISATFSLGKTNGRLLLTWADNQTINVDASLDLSRGINSSANFRTPFELARSGDAKFVLEGDLNTFQTTAEVSFNGKTVKLETSFTQYGKVQGRSELTSPWFNGSAEFEHNGNLQKFTNHAEVNYGKSITVDTSFNMQNGIDASIELNSPFSNVKGAYNHQLSQSSKLTAHAELSWDVQQRMAADLTFQLKPSVEVQLTLVSPWKSISSRYTHQGTMSERCNAELEFVWDTNNKISANWSLNVTNGVAVQVNVRTPWRDVAAELKHQGSYNDFQNTVSITYDTGKTAKLISSLSMKSGMTARTTFTSPFKNANVLYTHTGDLKKGACHFEGKLDRSPVTADLQWNTVSGYSATFTIDTPVRDINAEFKTNNDIRQLASSALFKWDTNQQIDGTLRLNTRAGVDGALILNTPWRNVQTELKTNNDIRQLTSSALFKWDTNQQIDGTFRLDTRAGVDGALILNTPWRNVQTELKTNNDIRQLISSALIKWDTNQQIDGTLTFNTRSGIDGVININTPWRVLSAMVQHSGDQSQMSNKVNLSWETGKEMTSEFRFKTNPLMATWDLNTPWKAVNAKVNHDGDIRSFNSLFEVSWEPTKKITTSVMFDRRTGVAGKVTINTPWRDLLAEVEHSGNWSAFSSRVEASWETGKRVAANANFSLTPFNGKVTINLPERDLTAEITHTGNLNKFNCRAELSWEPTKQIIGTVSFDASSGFNGSFRLSTPWRNIEGKFDHQGDVTDFSNSAEFSYENGKKIAGSCRYNMKDGLDAEAHLKTPFYSDIDVVAKFTGDLASFNTEGSLACSSNTIRVSASKMAKSGRVMLTSSYADDLTAEYSNAVDPVNWDAKVAYGSRQFEAKSSWAKGNGYTGRWTLKTPFSQARELEAAVETKGTVADFTNDLSFRLNQDNYALQTTFNQLAKKISQTATTPFTGYETVSWSTEYQLTGSALTGKFSYAKNLERFELNFEANMVSTSSYSGNVRLITPLAGYEENGFEASIAFSPRMYSETIKFYRGSKTNERKYEMKAENSGNTWTASMNTNIFSGEESSTMTFTYMRDGGRLTSSYAQDLKFVQSRCANFKFDIDVAASRTSDGRQHNGLIQYTYGDVTRKAEWSMGSNKYMCETNFTMRTVDREDQTYTLAHKTTWTTSYDRMTHTSALKTPYEPVKDTAFNFSYDLSSSKKVFTVSMFNDPSHPFDLKTEVNVASDPSFSTEMTTPFKQLSLFKTSVTIQKTSQPWSIQLNGQLNDQTVTASGNMKYDSIEQMEGMLKFSSQIPMFEDLQLTFKNAKLESQYRPNFTLQWASNKRIDLSGTFGWDRQLKAALDLNTPFDSLRSLTTDITILSDLPNKLTANVELKTNKMSERFVSMLNFDLNGRTASLSINSPWAVVKTFEANASLIPRVTLNVSRNGKNLAKVDGTYTWRSLVSHNLDMTLEYPFLNKYMRVKINNDLSFGNDKKMMSDMQLEYTKGKKITLTYQHDNTARNVISLTFTSPFAKFESIKYTLDYSGKPTNWSETSSLEFFYGKVTTSTTFNLEDGIAYHQSVSGDMKNGVTDFTMQKDLVFKGDKNKFDLSVSTGGSVLPKVELSTSWQLKPSSVSIKANLNSNSLELAYTGQPKDFTSSWKVVIPDGSWMGNLAVKVADRVNISGSWSCPDNDIKFNLNSDLYSGSFSGQWQNGSNTANYSASFSRTASPYQYKGDTSVDLAGHTYSTSVTLSAESLNFLVKFDSTEIVNLKASNKLNADNEYVPEILLTLGTKEGDKSTYEFDGLYKNEGEGLVRDMKLHLNGPRGSKDSIAFQLEFKTLSAQMVPGNALFKLGYVNGTGKETTIVDMTAEWGNDRMVVVFVEPQPMKFAMDFSVSTRGQTGEMAVNWDTKRKDASFKLNFENQFKSYNGRITHLLDIDVLYLGVTRGLKSNLDYQLGSSFKQRFTVDYNNQEAGYDVFINRDKQYQGSLEILNPWRSVKVAWDSKAVAKGVDVAANFFWDSQRDVTKKMTGRTVFTPTAANTYKWTTTISHPAFSKDLVLADTIAYNTKTSWLVFEKKISFSTDSSKDITFNIAIEKNQKYTIGLAQPFNTIDIRFGTEFTEDRSGTVSVARLQYLGTDGRMKTMFTRAAYSLKDKSFSLEINTPVKAAKLELVTTEKSGNYNSLLTATVDGNIYKTTLVLKPADYYMQVKVNYDPSTVQNYINFESMKLNSGYQVKLVKQLESETVIEGLAALSFNQNKTFNGKLYWNPAVYTEVKDQIMTLRSQLKELVKAIGSSSQQEVAKKIGGLRLGDDFTALSTFHQQEMTLASNDLEAVRNAFSDAMSKDVLLMRTMKDASMEYSSRIQAQFEELKDRVTVYYQTTIQPQLQELNIQTEAFRQQLNTRLSLIEREILKLQDLTATKWLNQQQIIADAVTALVQWLQQMAGKVRDVASTHPSLQSLRDLHTNTMNTFNTYSDLATSKVSTLADPQQYASIFYDAQTYLNNTLNGRLSTVVSSRAVQNLGHSIVTNMKFYYDYYDVAENAELFLKHSRNVAAEYINDWLSHYVDETLNDFKWVVLDPQNGRIEFDLTIPMQLGDLSLAQLKSNLKERLQSVSEHMAKYHFNLKEMFYMYKPRSLGQMFPPYNAHAIIAGQHIRTFDRRHYDFASGTCSYLLARDFHHGNFSIFVNYNGKEQSLTVHSNGRIVDIMQDNTVKVDGGKIELPVQFYNTTITRLGHLIVLNSKLGVKVTCDNDHGLCTVDMSGFYFAKTGGLFGTYNNEPSDDFTMSNNKNTSDIAEFAASWAKSCNGNNVARSFVPVEGTKEYRACAAIFRDWSSSLSPCFSVVNTEDFFHKCVDDMSLDVTLTEKNGPCKAAKFYETECMMAGVTVTEPAQCVTCVTGEATIAEGQQVKLPVPAAAADIVVVVEEKMCNYDTSSKLPQLVAMLEASLKSSKFTDIRFGLVGFGGLGVHSPAHTHTMDSKQFAVNTDFKRGSEALVFGDGENRDVFEAVDFAAQYPFRAGAVKIIVAIPCSDCSESRMAYSYLSSRLMAEDISLHLINNFTYETVIDAKVPETNYLFGIDNKAVFSMKDMGKLKGNTKLFTTVSKPKDQCSYLALQTGGSIWDLGMMTKQRANVGKTMQSVLADRVAITSVPSQCQVCSCEYNKLFSMARSICKKC